MTTQIFLYCKFIFYNSNFKGNGNEPEKITNELLYVLAEFFDAGRLQYFVK
ncbi:hypothetical protein [Ferruginibacter sp.]